MTARSLFVDALPDWWWFRDYHSLHDDLLRINGVIVSKQAVTREVIDCITDAELLDLRLVAAPDAMKSRFWFLPEDCVSGIQIDLRVARGTMRSRVALSSRMDGKRREFPFLQVHDWKTRQPAPPITNIERVSGKGATEYNYFCNGASDFLRFYEVATRHGVDFGRSTTKVLDWGAGCGRLTRWFSELTAAQIHGVDIDPDNIQWCRDHLVRGDFSVVELYPPTAFEAETFDLIIGNSVLSHLTLPAMEAWLGELRRIGRRGGLALLSYHGDFSNAYFLSHLAEVASFVFSEGFYDKPVATELIGIIPDPEYYRQTFMSDRRAHEIFRASGFEILDVLIGYVSRSQNLAVLRI